MQAHVASVGLEGPRLDRVLDRRQPYVGEELGEGLSLRRDVGPLLQRPQDAGELSLRRLARREPPAACLPSIDADAHVDDEVPGAVVGLPDAAAPARASSTHR